MQGFFAIDLMSTIPWDIVLTNPSLGLVQLFKATKVIKLVRIIRFLKLVRILRLLKVLFSLSGCKNCKVLLKFPR